MNTPLLQVIFSHLEPLTNHASEAIRKTSLEARLVLTTRQASSAAAQPNSPQRRSDLEVYQQALKLVQDPILPVRAHGLLMLRQLVVPPRTAGKSSLSSTSAADFDHPEVDPALIPAILDVFMQSVQDDDSFVFLNAVQGLSAMVDRLGRNILIRLMNVYAGERDSESLVQQASSISKTELDKRLRVGEALEQVVRRCGDALPAYGTLRSLTSSCNLSHSALISMLRLRLLYSIPWLRSYGCQTRAVDVMVPGLLRVFRSSHIATNLRSSALSILAASMEVSSIALLPWTDELVSGMIDLLQVESVSFATPALRSPSDGKQRPATNVEEQSASRTKTTEEPLVTDSNDDSDVRSANLIRHRAEDAVPALTISAKAPTLRRSALHFLSLLLRAFVLRGYARMEETRPAPISSPKLGSDQSPLSMHDFLSGKYGHGSYAQPSILDAPMDRDVVRRVSTIVQYVCETDVDGIVRVQASECADLLEQLAEVRIGMIMN